ncbi:HET-domain-containing protein [Nemania serpens]|nr:HET-domain-containing protein [Nemania serpens]
MYLLNVATRQLQEFVGDRIPPYAILSHTWGKDEVLFQDLQDPSHKEKLGYTKIEGCCQEAIRDALKFVWVDTCCIDKRSSAELSEAINSMFRWYGEAKVCYVYLADVSAQEDPGLRVDDLSSEPRMLPASLCNSRWFTRGWTLQELISPRHLVFFDREWTRLFAVNEGFSNKNPIRWIEEITGIEEWNYYWWRRPGTRAGISLEDIPVATKLSWVSRRRTTRVEDMAYCLLGLLDVNMPLLYGEGDRAFLRLQEEFLKKYHDPTIFCWGFGMSHSEIDDIERIFGLDDLARTPLLFSGCRGLDLWELYYRPSIRQPRLGWVVTPYGLSVELSVVKLDAKRGLYIGIASGITLNKGGGKGYLLIPLLRHRGSDSFSRVDNCITFCLTSGGLPEAGRSGTRRLCLNNRKLKPEKLMLKRLFLRNRGFSFNPPLHMLFTYVIGSAPILDADGFIFDSVYPPSEIVQHHNTMVIKHISIFGEQDLVMVLHRKRQDTLYLRLTYPIYKPRGWKCKILLCLRSYEDRRSAIEVWDADRKPWRGCFPYPPQLDWQQAVTVNVDDRVESIFSIFGRLELSGRVLETATIRIEEL